MRLFRLIPAAFILFMSGPVFTQGWIEYSNRVDRFSVNFPGEPKVQEIRYTSSVDGIFPARVYTAEEGRNRYSVTVVDYTDAERIDAERAKLCNADAQSLCAGDANAAQGVGQWRYDVRAAMDFATWDILKRDAKVTFFAWAVIDRVEGRQIHLTNADRSRTLAGIHMHEGRLYIFEATVPQGEPDPAIFYISPRFLDAEGRPVRYDEIYTNMPPKGRGQGEGGRGRGAGGRGRGIPQ